MLGLLKSNKESRALATSKSLIQPTNPRNLKNTSKHRQSETLPVLVSKLFFRFGLCVPCYRRKLRKKLRIEKYFHHNISKNLKMWWKCVINSSRSWSNLIISDYLPVSITLFMVSFSHWHCNVFQLKTTKIAK